jgi:hypothetical protein
MFEANLPSPQPSPPGRGSPAAAVVRASPLPPNPLADLATLDGNLAKARLLGEGQGEGRFPQFKAQPAAILARMNESGAWRSI